MEGEAATAHFKPNHIKCKVIIIGAGVAGLAAANYLSSKGEKDFKILEARDRIGGRILTITTGNERRLDLGASWIHGLMGNPVYQLALQSGLACLQSRPHTVVATTEEGHRVPIAVVNEVYGAYFWFCKRCEEYFRLRIPCPESVSVGAHLRKDIECYLQRFEDPHERTSRNLVFRHLLNREACITGVHSMDEIALADFGSFFELPGGNVTIPTGFSSMLDLLACKLPAGAIVTDHCVQRIFWKGGSLVEVQCFNGQSFFADHVLVTLPLGVLKEHVISLFEPPLPDYKLDCIRRLSFGTVNKIFLEYNTPFLNPDLSEILTLWSESSEEEIEKSWFRKIYSFVRCGDNALLAWVSGREAEYLETLSDEEVGNSCTSILRKFLGDPFVPKPSSIVRSNWRNESFSRGSYTSISVGSSQQDVESLAKPIYSDPYKSKPVLLFAGEATHSVFYSTVHGAYLSGLNASRLLLDDSHGNASLSTWLKGIDLCDETC